MGVLKGPVNAIKDAANWLSGLNPAKIVEHVLEWTKNQAVAALAYVVIGALRCLPRRRHSSSRRYAFCEPLRVDLVEAVELLPRLRLETLERPDSLRGECLPIDEKQHPASRP